MTHPITLHYNKTVIGFTDSTDFHFLMIALVFPRQFDHTFFNVAQKSRKSQKFYYPRITRSTQKDSS